MFDEQNRDQESGAEENQSDSSAPEREPISYSWVNPKLQHREETKEDQNWSGKSFAEGLHREERSDAMYSPGSVNRPTRKGTAGRWLILIGAAILTGVIIGAVSFGTQRVLERGGTGQADTGKTPNTENLTAPVASVSNETDKQESSETDSSAKDKETEAEQNRAVSAVVSKTMPSVVTISTISVQEMLDIFGGTQNYQIQGAGSGVIVGENDTELLIATNAHVVVGAQQLSVGFNDETAVSGVIKGQDSGNDLAVVAVTLSDIPETTRSKITSIELGDSDQIVLGEQVVALGNALGLGTSVTSGYISALDRTVSFEEGVETEDLIQTDAAINSGNSGGALVNMEGQLIGINEGRASSTNGVTVDNVGYSIPISKAKPILEKMMSLTTRSKVSEEKRGYLGVKCMNVNEEAARQYSIPVGIYIQSVTKNGAADAAGIHAGDVITEVDGRSVTTYEELIEALSYYESHETISIVINRSKNGEYQERTVEVTLSTKSEAGLE